MLSNSSCKHLTTGLTVAAMTMLATTLSAQSAPPIRTNTPELGCFGGGSYGIDKARFMGGCNFVYSIKPREVMPYVEGSYFPGIGRTATNIPGLASGATRTFNLPISDINTGFHFRWVVPGRVIPYGVLGVGLIHNGAHTEQFTTPNTLNPSAPPVLLDPFKVAASTNFTVSFGGGLRVYATEHVGFRGEFKAYKPTGGLDMFYRATGGFFYQF